MIVIQTNHWINKEVTNSFAHGLNLNKIDIKNFQHKENETVVTYGIKRGTEKILKQSKSYIYIDHGYFGSSDRKFVNGTTRINNLDGYFRLVKNDLIHSGKGNYDDKRIKKFNIQFKPIRKKGDFIIVSEPSSNIMKYLNVKNWKEKTLIELSKYTDRKIYIHNKQSPMPLNLLLERAWAFVSLQSTAGFKAMISGVPAHYTYEKLQHINPIQNIEKGNINYQIFNNLAYGQWTLKEIRSGESNNYINNNII